MREINLVLNKYREKLYVFVEPIDRNDLFVRERIAIRLVRVAQSGNVLAKLQLVKLVRYTIDTRVETYRHISRWKGRNDEIRQQLEGCIRRYRYTGSFLSFASALIRRVWDAITVIGSVGVCDSYKVRQSSGYRPNHL
jgi:hypothetical protein